jgi:hypothetical protein
MKLKVSQTFTFEREVARLNKKAAKIGVPPITFQNLGKRTVTRTVVTSVDGDVSERQVPVDVTEYELNLPTVEDRKWKLIAKITPAEGAGVRAFVDSTVKGFDKTPFENGDPCRCDHCHSNRHRNLTYVVQNQETGAYLQLGRNCFADYIGRDTLLKLEFCAVISATFSDDDGFFPSSGGRDVLSLVSLRDVIAVAEIITEAQGKWVNNSYDDFGEIVAPGTHRIASNYVRGTGPQPVLDTDFSARLWNLSSTPEDPVWSRVDAAIEELKDLDLADDEFGLALQYCTTFELIPAPKAALAAYTCQYLRSRARRAELEAKKATLTHVGTVGKREVFTLTLKRVTSFESQYGTTFILIFEDAAGNQVVWKTSRAEFNEGETVTLKATVKEHGEYNGVPQTSISRAKQI